MPKKIGDITGMATVYGISRGFGLNWFLLTETEIFFRGQKKDALKKDSFRLCSFAVLIIA
jgi:hypothetical protein